MRKLLPGMMIAGLIACQPVSQQNVFAFFEYDLKDGMADRFIEGYAKDLEWHASQEDDWSWAGWFVTTGEPSAREKLRDLPFVWMQTVSGGELHEYLLFVGMETLEGLDACANLFDFSSGPSADYTASVRQASSELWSYSERLSLYPDQ
jgi:hypothetical protein